MTFYKSPPTLTFGDKHEVLLKEISLGSTFPGAFKIKVENEDKDMDPVFRIEDSIFKGTIHLRHWQTFTIFDPYPIPSHRGLKGIFNSFSKTFFSKRVSIHQN